MAVVIDNGSGFMKVGIAGDEAPKYVFPTIVADVESSNALVGEAALAKGEDNVVRPLRAGEVRDEVAMEKVWQHALDKVGGGGKDKPVLITEPILNAAANREKMCQIMFEKLNVPSVYIANQPVLALYATGRKTGVVLDVGESLTQCAPIFDGYAVTEGLSKSHLAGGKLTGFMRDRLQLSDNQSARDIKETLCYLVADPEAELKKDPSALEASYTLPDGSTIKVGAERVQVPELLFSSPCEAGSEANTGLAKMVTDSVQKCEIDVRKDIARNVVLAGGSTLFKGMDARLNAATPDNFKVVGAKNIKHTTWIGGSILASMVEIAAGYITKKEFEEGGLSAIQKKIP